MSLLVNEYNARTAKNEATCFICHRITTTVLTSMKSKPVDWFYCCVSHLKDPGFCKESVSTSNAADLPVSNNNNNNKEKESNAIEAGLKSPDSTSSKNTNEQSKNTQESSVTSDVSNNDNSPALPSVYILHRNIFYLRESRLAARQKAINAQSSLAQLPSVPTQRGP